MGRLNQRQGFLVSAIAHLAILMTLASRPPSPPTLFEPVTPAPKRPPRVALLAPDREVLETFLRCIARSAHIGASRSGFGSLTLRVQLGDVGLYRWLQAIGLTPRKSHTLGAIDCPQAVFPHLLRGLLDGDGSIIDGTYKGSGKARGHEYRVLKVRFISASRAHVLWLQQRITAEFGLSGSIRCENPVFGLTYSKRASVQLLRQIYPEPGVPCLRRKQLIWERFQREFYVTPLDVKVG